MSSNANEADRDEREAVMALFGGPSELALLPERSLLANMQSTKLVKWAQIYDPEESGGALLLGPTSIGKTCACVYAVKRLVKGRRAELRKEAQAAGSRIRLKGLQVEWVRAVDLASARLQHALGDGEADLVKRCHASELLVIDDCGWENKSDTIAQVLSVRYDRGLPVVATSNYTNEQLLDRYGAAIIRRLLECRGHVGQIVSCWGGP